MCGKHKPDLVSEYRSIETPDKYAMFQTCAEMFTGETEKVYMDYVHSCRETPRAVLSPKYGNNWADSLGDSDKEAAKLRTYDDIYVGILERSEYFTQEYYEDSTQVEGYAEVPKQERLETFLSVVWEYTASFGLGVLTEHVAEYVLEQKEGEIVGDMSALPDRRIVELENTGCDILTTDGVKYQVKSKRGLGDGKKQRKKWKGSADYLIILDRMRSRAVIFE